MNDVRTTLRVLGLAAVLAVGACSGSGDDDSDDAGSAATTSTPLVAPATEVGSSATPTATTIGPSGPGCASLPAEGEGSVAGMADDGVAVAAGANPELSTLAVALDAADLLDTLNGPGPFTVFAPVESAFAAVADLDAVLADPERLDAVLSLHIVEGRQWSAAELAAAGSIQAVGGDLAFSAEGGALMVNGAATVVCADVSTANATVHLIDTVLTPPVDEEAVGGTQLYSVDLETGAATRIGAIGRELGVLGLAIAPGGGVSTVYGLTDAPELVTFDAADPSSIASTVPITGVAEGSTLLAIDVRPADGVIVAASDAGVLYTIDPATGLATPVGDPIDPPIEDPGFGLDVNPVVDRVRIAVVTGQNLRVDPDSGQPTVDTILTYAADAAEPRIVAVAYTNPVAGATETRLYAIDAATASLALVDRPNDGVMGPVGALGVSVTDGTSFDIATTGEALLASPG